MAYSQTQLAALEKALASGVTRVSYEGRSVEYRSLAEIREAIAEVRASLAGRRVRQVRVSTRRGL